MFVPRAIAERRLKNMLAEDLGQGDITTSLTVPPDLDAEAEIIAKEKGVAAGIEEAKILLESLGLETEIMIGDGEEARAKQTLLKIRGNGRTILSAERTVLNILSRMSGIATTTRALAKKIEESGFKARLASTRKTAPGLMYFDKKAVHIGGGDTHRLHLDDLILLKDNHIKIAGSVQEALRRAKRGSFSKKIEIELTNTSDVTKAAKGGADIIMLDNIPPQQIRKAIALLSEAGALHGKVLLEASGGISEENILEYASTGVDIISLGEITDSPKALDMSLEITETKRK